MTSLLAHQQGWKDYLKDCSELLEIVESLEVSGRITKLTGW